MTVGGGTSRLEGQLEKELYSMGCFFFLLTHIGLRISIYIKMLWVFCGVIGINFLLNSNFV